MQQIAAGAEEASGATQQSLAAMNQVEERVSSQQQTTQQVAELSQALQNLLNETRNGIRNLLGNVDSASTRQTASVVTITELEKQAGAQGMQWRGYQATRPDDQTHTPYLSRLGDAGAIWISNNASGAKTMAAAQQAVYQGKIVGGSGMQNINFLEAAGDAARGAMFAAPNYQYPIRDKSTWKPGYREHIEAVVAAMATPPPWRLP